MISCSVSSGMSADLKMALSNRLMLEPCLAEILMTVMSFKAGSVEAASSESCAMSILFLMIISDLSFVRSSIS